MKIKKSITSKLAQFKQWILSIVSVSVASSDVGKCTKCRFNCEDDHAVMNDCNVGSYYAEKGLNRICYEGELREATEQAQILLLGLFSVSKGNIRNGDTIIVNMKNKHKDFWISKVVVDDGELMLESNSVYLDSIPEKWIIYVC